MRLSFWLVVRREERPDEFLLPELGGFAMQRRFCLWSPTVCDAESAFYKQVQKVTFPHLPPTWEVLHVQTRRAVFATQYPCCYKSCEYKNIDLTWVNLSKVGMTLPSIQESQSCELVTFYFLSHLNDENITTCVGDEQIKTRGNDSPVKRRVTLERIKATDCWVSGTVKEVSVEGWLVQVTGWQTRVVLPPGCISLDFFFLLKEAWGWWQRLFAAFSLLL